MFPSIPIQILAVDLSRYRQSYSGIDLQAPAWHAVVNPRDAVSAVTNPKPSAISALFATDLDETLENDARQVHEVIHFSSPEGFRP
jgi:hypothetical protein